MSYTLKDYENYLEKLKEVNQVNWVKNYLELKKKPNFWTIIEYGRYESSKDRSAHETRMSKMIRWMMDPNENHNLGNVFAHKLMDLLDISYEYCSDKNKEIKAIAEYKDIDVFYKDLSRKMCLAIEVKQHAKEGITKDGVSQLDKYELIVEKLAKEKRLEAHYIFLTPLKEESTNKNWYNLGYQELIDLVDKVNNDCIIKSSSPYVEDVKKIIMDFRDELQRTLDIHKKDKSTITKRLSDKEKKLTESLAKEIKGDSDSRYMDELVKLNKEDLDINELILLVNDYLCVQDHSRNNQVQVLIRKIYNYLSVDKCLDTSQIKDHKVNETKTTLKPTLINSNGIKFVRMELTRGKGQGINMYTDDGKHRIYLSGDAEGKFPNDGVQLLKNPNDGRKIISNKLKPRSFELSNNLIIEDKINDKNGNMITFDQLMKDYLIVSLEELSNKIDQL